MEGHTTGILKARERENTDQGEKVVDNIIHQSSQGRKDLGEEEEVQGEESPDPGPSDPVWIMVLEYCQNIKRMSHHNSNDNNNKNYSKRNNEHHDYLGKFKSLQH